MKHLVDLKDIGEQGGKRLYEKRLYDGSEEDDRKVVPVLLRSNATLQ